jgi:magnesium-transporting ATPase (P-type)
MLGYTFNNTYENKSFQFIIFLCLLYCCINIPILFSSIVFFIVIIDNVFRYYYKFYHPVSLDSVTFCFGFSSWFFINTFKLILFEFKNFSVLFGWFIVAIQIFHYTNPLKQYKSIPNNLAFLLGSVISSFISTYNTLYYEKKFNSKIIKKINNGSLVDIPLYKAKYGDIISINYDLPTDINYELFSDLEQSITVNLQYVTGESKFIKKKCHNINKIIVYNDIPYSIDDIKECLTFLPKGAVIKKNNFPVYGRIIKTFEDNKFNLNKPYLLKFIESKKKQFIYSSLFLATLLFSTNYFMNNYKSYEIDYITLVIQIIISSLMIVPLSYNTIINIIFILIKFLSKHNFTYIKQNLCGLDKIPIDSFECLINYNNSFLVSDKTGTITENKMIIIDFKMLNNTLCNDNIVPLLADQIEDEIEESEMIQFLISQFNHSYTHSSKYITKNLKKNYKIINQVKYETIFIGLFRNLGGTITLIFDKDKFYFIYQGVPSSVFIKYINFKGWKDSLYYRDQFNIFNNNPNRDWFHFITDKFDTEIFNNTLIANLLSLSDEKNYGEYVINLFLKYNIFESFSLIDIFFMENPLKFNVSAALYSFNKGFNSVICTGDNEKNSLLVFNYIGLKYNNVYYINQIENKDMFKKIISQYKNNLFIFTNFKLDWIDYLINTENYFIISCCNPSNKQTVVSIIQNRKFHVTFTGDGMNDILALKQADLGIAFPKDNEFNYLPQVIQSSNVSISNFSHDFWHDWYSGKFNNIFSILKFVSVWLLLIMVIKNAKSGIQLGSLLAIGQMTDPFPNPVTDFLFDILLTLHWCVLPLVFSINGYKMNSNLISYFTFILGFCSYNFGVIISYFLYSSFDIQLAMNYSLFTIYIFHLLCFFSIYIYNIGSKKNDI